MSAQLQLRDCHFFGPALPEPFVKFQIVKVLKKLGSWPKRVSKEDKKVHREAWTIYRRKLRKLGNQAGKQRVSNHIFEGLIGLLGYDKLVKSKAVRTREGDEDGGWLMELADGSAKLRCWSTDADTDLDAPARRGKAYRFSPTRVAMRVLMETQETLGLLTDGEELRLLIRDPSRRESHISILLTRSGGWRGTRTPPESLTLLIALAGPCGVANIAQVLEEARKAQTTVTDELRGQARQAIQGFLQELVDHPENRATILKHQEEEDLAATLWKEGLKLVYRLLFILKLETSPEPERGFSFASVSLWRNTYSPSGALAPIVRRVLDEAIETGDFLEQSLRATFRAFERGLKVPDMNVPALGGALFGPEALPLIDSLQWGEQAVARLLDHLLWVEGKKRSEERRRVYYGPLDVEELGRVYESLLELEPGIATEDMCRLRRNKLEVVVAVAQGEEYRSGESNSKVQWIEEIPEGRFYLRVGLGRKSSGSYYTPHAFVSFLVRETCGPLCDERSRDDDPYPKKILELKVCDPAMGSGHFLVEACRYLGERLYEACRLCDEKATELRHAATLLVEEGKNAEAEQELARAKVFRDRLDELPDIQRELISHLPSASNVDEEESELSQRRARAVCRRLVAIHCLYGVDKNELAVELAKVALWLESFSEGLPLTFLDHRLVQGDSLTGPRFSQLIEPPLGLIEGEERKKSDYFHKAVRGALDKAILEISQLDQSIAKDIKDIEQKRAAKRKLDELIEPWRELSKAWSGCVMLADENLNRAYDNLLEQYVEGLFEGINEERWQQARCVAGDALAWDLAFPDVFFRKSEGFDVVIGNPPWDSVQPAAKEFFAAYDLRVLDAPTRKEGKEVEERLTADEAVSEAYQQYLSGFEQQKRLYSRCYEHVNRSAGGASSGAVLDLWQCFAERGVFVLKDLGRLGWVLPSALHANQSATGIRDLYLKELDWKACFSFENRNRLFNIHRSFKFATIVAQRSKTGTSEMSCAFYRHDLDWLTTKAGELTYTREFIEKSGLEYRTLSELRQQIDVDVSAKCFSGGVAFGEFCEESSIKCGEEAHMSKSSHLFVDISEINKNADSAYLPLHEGKTFHQYTDRWSEPRYAIPLSNLEDKSHWKRPAQFYRLAFRAIARSTDERTSIFMLIPPGYCFGHSAPSERTPWSRRNINALIAMSVCNSFPFDWNLRQKASANVSLFILNSCPVPGEKQLAKITSLLVHSALRLSCKHKEYHSLWKEQLGEDWKESGNKYTWPVLHQEASRWALRAAMDALIAQAYGLNRHLYEHVLSSFSHTSFPDAPTLCLQAFDELSKIGTEAFCRKYDPYHDVPLNNALPKPVIELPGVPKDGDQGSPSQAFEDLKGQGQLFSPDQGNLLDKATSSPPSKSKKKSSNSLDKQKIKDQLLQALRNQAQLNSNEAQKITGCSASQVRGVFQELIDSGDVLKTGKARGTRYQLTSDE